MVFRNTLKLTDLKCQVDVHVTKTNKQTNKPKTGKKKTKQKKDELPLHAYSDIAQYVPLQLYLITIIYHNYHNYT